jgi:hypothetical protein
MTTAPAPRLPAPRLPAAAGIAYLAAWVVGLAVWPTNLALNATAAEVARSFRLSAGQAAAQVLLVEGIAGVLLGIVLASLLRAAPTRDGAAGPGHRRRSAGWQAAALLSAAAVAVSLVQCVVGLLLVAAADHQETARSGDLYDALNRLDGVKMIALAIAALCLAAPRSGAAPRQPRWLQVTAVLLAVSLVGSGLAYLLLWNGLAWAVYASGPLLLLWVTGLGIWLTRRQRGARENLMAASLTRP